ncbi:hypothetical protein ACLOJK_015479 [Asimina triloba]
MLLPPFSSSACLKCFSFCSPYLLLKPAKSAAKPQRSSQEAAFFFLFAQWRTLSGTCQTTLVSEFQISSSFLSESLKFAAKNGFLSEGQQLHACTEKSGCGSLQSIKNQLLSMYLKCGPIDDACNLFGEMPVRNVVSWNIMISGCVSFSPSVGASEKMDIGLFDSLNENLDAVHNLNSNVISLSGTTSKHVCYDLGPTENKVLNLPKFWRTKLGVFFFKKMLSEMPEPNYITFVSVLGASLNLNDIEFARQLHCLITKAGFSSDSFVGSALVDLYAKFQFVEDARQAFDVIRSRDLVLWNVMVSCFSFNGLGGDAFGIFHSMRLEGMMGDDFTFSSLLNACCSLASCEPGKQIHGYIVRLGLDLDVVVASALVDMYAKKGLAEDARKVFSGMMIRNLVSWTTMIVGYGQNGEGREAMELFRLMLQEGLKPDELTLASLLSSCANLAAANEATQLHTHVLKTGLEAFLSIGNSLINVYARCGCIISAFKYFSSISCPDLVTWTSMIGAYAFHGLAGEALEIFEEMLHEGFVPDQVAFLGVFSACSHSGLVVEGFRYFYSMIRDYQILPNLEHYTCMVDLLGRAAFISACRVHGDIRSAKWASGILFEVEPDDAASYTIMSNVYAAAGSWTDVARES